MIIIIMKEHYVNLLTISAGSVKKSDEFSIGFALSSVSRWRILRNDGFNGMLLCEDIHKFTETNIMGIDEISPEIEPINVQGGAYVN